MSDIRTRPITTEYEAGFEAAGLGKSPRRPGRTRYVQDPKTGALTEVGADWEAATRSLPVVGDAHYDGARSPVDGTDISSRTKHREYLKRTGLAMAGDYTQSWEKAEAQRYAPTAPDRSRRDDIGRAIHDLEKRGRR